MIKYLELCIQLTVLIVDVISLCLYRRKGR